MKTIALFVYDPKCSVQCCNAVLSSLEGRYNIKLFSKNKVESCFFNDVDMVIVPGGIGDSETFHSLFKNNAEYVKNFISKGGKYLGICMGAYWAGQHYFNIIGDTQAEQYITRPNTDTRRPHAKAIKVNWNGEDMKMFFYDGCALFDGAYETVATYANGDAMAIKKGRIGLIGCHPEAEKDWYDLYSWMKKDWQGDQHKLLLDFTKSLL